MFLTPRAIYNKRLEEGLIKPDPEQRQAADALHKLHQDIMEHWGTEDKGWFGRLLQRRKKPLPYNGLYVHGGVGRGKSMLMDLFYDCLPGTVTKRRVHFHQFMIDVHNFLNNRKDLKGPLKSMDAALPLLAEKIFEESRILCFDEFHVTDIADAMILGRLFTLLFKKGIIVVATSNWEPDRLYEGGLKRDRFLPFIQLLKENMVILHLDSETDYRAQSIMQEGNYFWPLGDSTRQKVTELFGKLLDYEVPREERLEIRGREILVQAALNGVARFTFSQLCEQPLGAEDYITIAKTYETVFVEGIPKMGYDRSNEVKRFMTLIDALYENKTRLVVSADATPDKLYYGHDYAFEFERTVSRLKEMQSAGYLERKAA